MDKYEKYYNLPHHVSLNHKRMSNHDRAAQFAPFAALTGYDALIREVARETSKKIIISSDKAEEISNKLVYIKEHFTEIININIIYFKKDKKKEGGEYLSINGIVSRIDDYHKCLKVGDVLIKFNDIYDINIPNYQLDFDV